MDVKQDNIYMALDGSYKLGDFGLAALQNNKGVEPIEGDGRYAAPEAVQGLSQVSGTLLPRPNTLVTSI